MIVTLLLPLPCPSPFWRGTIPTSNFIFTSVKIIKNEIRYRDDTVPKTVDTRSHCNGWLRAYNNLQQPQNMRCREGVAEDCCILSTIPCSGFLYLQFSARCHPYILFHFYTCFTHFSLTVSISTNRELPSPSTDGISTRISLARTLYIRSSAHALALSAKIHMRDIELVTRKMASHIVETSVSHKVAF